MKTINMNTIAQRVAKSALATCLLLVATTLSAEDIKIREESSSQERTFMLQAGDTIIIDRACERYLTGEKMSSWVYYTSHTVLQLGTKRFPDGVLLKEILSWVEPGGLILKGAVPRADSVSQALAEQQIKEQKQKVNERAKETEQLSELQKLEIEQQAKLHGEELLQSGTTLAPADTVAQSEQTEPIEEQPKQEETAASKSKKGGYDRFSIGVRGGAAGLLHRTDNNGKWNCGFDAMLDLQYAHYWTNFDWPVDLGIITGLGIGYAQSGLGLSIDDQYTVQTSDGQIDYSLSADKIKENDGQLQLEIPVLFSLISEKGVFFNVGPKILLPLYTPYKQTITNPSVDAFFPEEGVHVSNEVITGKLEDDQLKSKGRNENQWKINVMLTAEIGYEWNLHSGNSLGLGAYANYSVYSMFKGQTENKSLMNITAPSATGAATVDILSATDTYANKLGYFDAGVKLVYHFNFPKKTRTNNL